jgi:hypothetical protein
MCKLIVFIISSLFVANTFAQKVPRPGGGGTKDYKSSDHKAQAELNIFYKSFKRRLKACDPKRKVEMDFEKIFNYLLMRQMDSLIKKQPKLKPVLDDCSKDSVYTINCILDNSIRKDLDSLIKNDVISVYYKNDRGFTQEEIQDRIEFLNLMLEK